MRRQVIVWLRIIWVLATMSIMVWGIAGCGEVANPTLRAECGLLWSIVLAAVGFPLTVVWWITLSAVGAAFSSVGLEIGLSPAFDAIAWIGFVVIGYVQWFVLLPRVWHELMPSDSGV